jgi:hypothetical protein
MDNLSELKEIWRTAKTDSLPPSAEMLRIVKKYRNQKLLKTAAFILIVMVLIAVMVLVMFNYHSHMLSTRFGEVFIIIAGAIVFGSELSSLVRFYYLKDESNKNFILFLERTRQRQLFYYKRTQIVGFAFCSCGLILYLYEGVYQDTTWFIVGYALLIAYLLFLWLFVRPRVFKRQERKIKEKIEHFEILLKQIDK